MERLEQLWARLCVELPGAKAPPIHQPVVSDELKLRVKENTRIGIQNGLAFGGR